VGLRNSAEERARVEMNKVFKEKKEIEKIEQEAKITPKDDLSKFNAYDLERLVIKYSSISHFDEQLRQLNRSLLGTWKQKMLPLVTEEDRKHINQKAKTALRECAAWNTICYWLTWPSLLHKDPAGILELHWRAKWVDTNAHSLLWLIRRDTWSEDLNVFQVA
ncbi:MAG: hypothetical protein Q9224_006079, partial [Gallowayella concinna]